MTNTHIKGVKRYSAAIPLTEEENARLHKILSRTGVKKQHFIREAVMKAVVADEDDLS